MQKFTYFISIILNFAAIGSAFAQPPIILQYLERPPYMQTLADGSVTGISATRAANAFAAAGIDFVWKKVPIKRQLATLQQNTEKVCSVGYYKTAERQRFAKFTQPISQDSTMVGLANLHFQIADNATLDETLAVENLRLLLKKAVFYGAYLEDKFQHLPTPPIYTYDDFELIIKAIQHGRAQLTFVPSEEVDYYVEKMGIPKSAVKVIHFATMPPGEKRYIMCSKSVDDDVIQKLNNALK